MEQCPLCKSLLRIGITSYSFENDDTPDKETIAYTNLPMLCVNSTCENYAGKDLSNPNKIVTTVRHKIN
ncbi:hypothetical protein SAMN05877753_111159 [Bacillus oleivorans]|uniref:Uncharacterized protein n=1 Tax=Bacillus oleivorans TaxID=1448271 RepID=A0A285D668_9BACI|nr:hypothetical protein SAMN05877753_111159 [Bacillus oleivorans]